MPGNLYDGLDCEMPVDVVLFALPRLIPTVPFQPLLYPTCPRLHRAYTIAHIAEYVKG